MDVMEDRDMIKCLKKRGFKMPLRQMNVTFPKDLIPFMMQRKTATHVMNQQMTRCGCIKPRSSIPDETPKTLYLRMYGA